jgi:hypothetical protein
MTLMIWIIYLQVGSHVDEMMRLNDRRTDMQIGHISRLLKRLTGCSGRYDDNSIETFTDPFHELFIYCIIFNRF